MSERKEKKEREMWKTGKRRMEGVVAESLPYLPGDIFIPRWRKLYCPVLVGPFEK